jgi:hypothetical protein
MYFFIRGGRRLDDEGCWDWERGEAGAARGLRERFSIRCGSCDMVSGMEEGAGRRRGERWVERSVDE